MQGFQNVSLLKEIAAKNSGKFTSVNKIPANVVLILPQQNILK
jgi:hypothetical protein